MFQFKLPDIGEGVVEAEVVKWHVREGDEITENQVMVELMTDKASIEIPSPKSGRVHSLCFGEGETVHVGEVLIELDPEGKGAASAQPPARTTEAVSRHASPAGREPADTGAKSTETQPDGTPSPPKMPPRPRHDRAGTDEAAETDNNGVRRAVPAVRQLAKRLGIDLESVTGTGPGGRVLRRDVERHLQGEETPPTAAARPAVVSRATTDPEDWSRQPLRGVRRVIAERMRRSKSTAAHYTYVEEVDMTELEVRRRECSREADFSPLVYVAWAVARALPGYPLLNASLDEVREEIILKSRVHLGIATATEEGLVVPVVRDANRLCLSELASDIRRLADGARRKALRADELTGSTFTISSLGKLGGILATPIINYPETAILGVHAIRTLPRYVGDALRPRRIAHLSVSLDHRVVDGAVCAEFVQGVKDTLEAADFPDTQEGSTHGP